MEIIFPNRIARISYLIRHVLFFLAGIPLIDAMDSTENKEIALVDLWILLTALVLVGYWVYYIIRPRCKDMGINPWFSLIAFIPFIDFLFGIMLLFTRSKPTEI